MYGKPDCWQIQGFEGDERHICKLLMLDSLINERRDMLNWEVEAYCHNLRCGQVKYQYRENVRRLLIELRLLVGAREFDLFRSSLYFAGVCQSLCTAYHHDASPM